MDRGDYYQNLTKLAKNVMFFFTSTQSLTKRENSEAGALVLTWPGVIKEQTGHMAALEMSGHTALTHAPCRLWWVHSVQAKNTAHMARVLGRDQKGG